jgi:hypothetical protein
VNDLLHPCVSEYLRRFDADAAALPANRRLSLRDEIEAHLRDAISSDFTDAEAAAVLSEFGSPAEIIGQEIDEGALPLAGERRPSWRRPLAIVGSIAAFALLIPVVIGLATAFHTESNPGPPSVVNEDPPGPPRVSEGQAYFEYLAAIEAMEYPLPPGAQYPEGVPEGLDAGPVEDGVMGSGAGTHLAHFTWLCAWESEYLAAFEDKDFKRIVEAESMLAGWVETEWHREFDQGGAWAEAVINPMKFGDPSGIRRDRASVCAQASIFNVRF